MLCCFFFSKISFKIITNNNNEIQLIKLESMDWYVNYGIKLLRGKCWFLTVVAFLSLLTVSYYGGNMICSITYVVPNKH